MIGILESQEKYNLLKNLRPQYIILKPSLLGGFQNSSEWMQFAEKLKIGFWVTSALESNIGLNAIAQWVAFLNVKGTQGLGTGNLFTNNIPMNLHSERGFLNYF